jgi:hypothetical protein
MKDFIDTRFRKHGAITPVIVLHIFKTRVTRVALTTTTKSWRVDLQLWKGEKIRTRESDMR